ncbi:MAG: class I SAM-dependent methyltransferase [Bacteroidota bacterium]|nr:class I SAM-dependent methyltransferase [Bacteroidota bacterium]
MGKYLDRCTIYFNYYLRAQTPFKIHSPFLTDLIEDVFLSKTQNADFEKIKICYKQLREDTSIIPDDPFARKHLQNGKTVAEFTIKAISPLASCFELYRLVKFLNSSKILELGSSVGLSSLSMALANPMGVVQCVEGNSFFQQKAVEIINQHALQNAHVIHDTFENFLKDDTPSYYDLVFLDGDHQYEPTLFYLKQLIPKLQPKGIILLDDIHWSKGMYQAWNKMISWPEIQTSLETSRWGLLFLNKELTKGTFSYINYKWKPWQIGLY